MIGLSHDFENLTLTSFPTTFEPLDLSTSDDLERLLPDTAGSITLVGDSLRSCSVN